MWVYVAEYKNRRRLAKLGFFEPLSNLNALDAEYLLEVAIVVEKEESKPKKKRGL